MTLTSLPIEIWQSNVFPNLDPVSCRVFGCVSKAINALANQYIFGFYLNNKEIKYQNDMQNIKLFDFDDKKFFSNDMSAIQKIQQLRTHLNQTEKHLINVLAEKTKTNLVVFDILLNLGINLNIVEPHHMPTALHWALDRTSIPQTQMELATKLIEAGADTRILDLNGLSIFESQRKYIRLSTLTFTQIDQLELLAKKVMKFTRMEK